MKSIQQIEEQFDKEFEYADFPLNLAGQRSDIRIKSFIRSQTASLLQEIIKKGEEAKKRHKYCKGFSVGSSVCNHCHNNWNLKKGINTALEPIRNYLKIINKEE